MVVFGLQTQIRDCTRHTQAADREISRLLRERFFSFILRMQRSEVAPASWENNLYVAFDELRYAVVTTTIRVRFDGRSTAIVSLSKVVKVAVT